jgi:hypothetical protein
VSRIFVLARVILRRLGLAAGVLASLAAAGFAIPATAAAKVTSLRSCQTIAAPGAYRLDADISTDTTGDCFDITASGVTLNLNGHTITTPMTGEVGVNVLGGATNANIVGPGTIGGWFEAAVFLGGGNGSLRGVTATDNFADIGILSAGNSIRGDVATGSEDAGIFAGPGATGNTIIGNFAHDNPDDLVDDNANCDSNVWRGNDFGTANQPCIH